MSTEGKMQTVNSRRFNWMVLPFPLSRAYNKQAKLASVIQANMSYIIHVVTNWSTIWATKSRDFHFY